MPADRGIAVDHGSVDRCVADAGTGQVVFGGHGFVQRLRRGHDGSRSGPVAEVLSAFSELAIAHTQQRLRAPVYPINPQARASM